MPDSTAAPTESQPAAPARDRWHIVKDVPLALIATMFLQTATIVWWASGINTRVENLEASMRVSGGDRDRLVRVEEKIEGTKDLLVSIDKRLERMEERRR